MHVCIFFLSGWKNCLSEWKGNKSLFKFLSVHNCSECWSSYNILISYTPLCSTNPWDYPYSEKHDNIRMGLRVYILFITIVTDLLLTLQTSLSSFGDGSMRKSSSWSNRDLLPSSFSNNRNNDPIIIIIIFDKVWTITLQCCLL